MLALLGSASARAASPKAAPALDAEKALAGRKQDERLQALEQVRRGQAKVSAATLEAGRKSDKDPLVRLRMLQALNATADARAALLDSLKTDADAAVRMTAAQELGNRVSDPAVVAALAEALEKDASADVRYACANSLALSQAPGATAALAQAAKHSDPALRRQAAVSLKRHRSAAAKAALKQLEKDADKSVRAEAAKK